MSGSDVSRQTGADRGDATNLRYGQQAAELLLAWIDDPERPPQQIVLQPTIRCGDQWRAARY